jgi:hypothetical protein
VTGGELKAKSISGWGRPTIGIEADGQDSLTRHQLYFAVSVLGLIEKLSAITRRCFDRPIDSIAFSRSVFALIS